MADLTDDPVYDADVYLAEQAGEASRLSSALNIEATSFFECGDTWAEYIMGGIHGSYATRIHEALFKGDLLQAGNLLRIAYVEYCVALAKQKIEKLNYQGE